jgi:hypothetical protein
MKRRTAQEQKLIDDERLMRSWHAWHREQLKEALVGPHRDVMGRLIAELKDLRSARELITVIETVDWTIIDANTRLIVLHEINTAIVRLRARSGQDPIDDALGPEPPRAFQLIRKIINQFPAMRGEADPGKGDPKRRYR